MAILSSIYQRNGLITGFPFVILPAFYLLTTLSLYFFVYKQINIPIPVLITSGYLCFSPILFVGLFGHAKGLFAMAGIFLLCGLAGQSLLPVLAGIALVSMIVLSLRPALTITSLRGMALDIAGIILFSILIFRETMRLLFPYVRVDDIGSLSIIMKGVFDTDTFFHLSVIRMIEFTGYPSSGLNGTPFLKYHFIGHYFNAFLGRLTGVPALELYFLIPGFIHIPLILLACILLVSSFGGSARGTFFFLPLLLYGFFPQSSPDAYHPWFPCFDVSNPVAIFFALLFVWAFVKDVPFPWLMGLFVLVLLAKGSMGMLLLSGYLLATLLEPVDWRKKMFRMAAIIMVFACVTAMFLYSKFSGDIHFKILSFIRDVPSLRAHGLMLLFYNQFTIYALFVVLLLPFFKSYRKTMREDHIDGVSPRAILLLCGVIIATTGLLNFTWLNGSHRHFIFAGNWLVLPVAAFLFSRRIAIRESREYRGYVAAGAFLLLGVTFTLYGRMTLYTNYLTSREAVLTTYVSQHKPSGPYVPDTEFKPYYDALRHINDHYGDKKLFVEIPETEKGFWNFSLYPFPRYWMPFYIPAISGKPALNGYNPLFMNHTNVAWYPPGSYGFMSYYDKSSPYFCGDGYEGKIIILTEAGVTNLYLISCDGSKSLIAKFS